MAVSQHNYDKEPRRPSPQLSPDEKRIANAVVDALRPELTALSNMIHANHHDIRGVHDELRAFRTEQNGRWEVNGEVWNKIDANMDRLLEQWQSELD